jgi:uncharacterized protein
MPGQSGGPAFTAEGMISLYEDEGPAIFERSLWDRIRSAEGLLDERYPPEGMRSAFRRHFGDRRLSEALTDVLITAYEIEERGTYFFRSAAARQDPGADFPLREVAEATSVAPTYFEPARLERPGGGPDLALIDGGVYASNPAMCAYAEAVEDGPTEEVLVVSLGTGELTRPIRYEDAKDWGLLEWAKPIIGVVFDGVSDVTDHQLGQILGADRYFRFQTRLDRASDDLDDASPENLRLLRQEAAELLREESDRLAALVGKLS